MCSNILLQIKLSSKLKLGKMIVKGETLIILILICLQYFTFAIESENCDCDTLQIHYSGDPKNYYNLTKQSKIINGKPFYYLLDAYILWWNNSSSSWRGCQSSKILPDIQVDRDLSCLSVSNDQNWTLLWKGDKGVIDSKCFRRNDECSAVREESGKRQDFIWEATYRAPCIFPFYYNKKTYYSCTKEDYDLLWCATATNASTLNLTQWGYCDESCLIQDTKGRLATIFHPNVVCLGRALKPFLTRLKSE